METSLTTCGLRLTHKPLPCVPRDELGGCAADGSRRGFGRGGGFDSKGCADKEEASGRDADKRTINAVRGACIRISGVYYDGAYRLQVTAGQ